MLTKIVKTYLQACYHKPLESAYVVVVMWVYQAISIWILQSSPEAGDLWEGLTSVASFVQMALFFATVLHTLTFLAAQIVHYLDINRNLKNDVD
jgi:hypothetical protein